MPADLATLAIEVDADKATAQVLQFGTASLKAAGETGVLESSVGVLETTMSRVRTLFGLGLFGFQFLKETVDAQDAMAQLEAGVKSTGTAAGFTAEQLGEQAQALQRVSTFSDEAVMHGQAVLLLFQRINGANFERAEKDAVDLAARLGGDVPEAARKLGRALEDPEQGLRGLRQAGVLFTDGQIEMLKTMVQTNQQAQAQTFILEHLEQSIGGSAAAARDTLGGALKGLVHDFGDLFEVTRSGSSPLINVINNVDSGVNFLKDHMGGLITIVGALAALYAGRLASSAGTYVTTQLAAARATMESARAELVLTEATTARAVETRLATELDIVHAQWLVKEAEIHIGCAYSIEDEAAATAELTAAKAQLVAAEEANIAATIALTDAQIAEAAAERTVTATTTVMGVVMTGIGNIARAMWAAIGGPIGAIVLGISALIYIWNKWRDSIKATDDAQKAAKAGLASDPALEAALAKQKRDADDQAAAILSARKANAERDAQTDKINALNAAYDRSSLALKVYSIELDANIEKVKAHKDAAQSEWAAIDASIDASTRAQIAAAKLDFSRSFAESLQDLKDSNAQMIQAAENAGILSDAQEGIGIAQMINARAGVEAQVAYDHLNVALEANTKIEAARIALVKASKNATDEEIAAAQAYYDETVRGIEAEQRIKDATIDRTRAIEDLKDAMHGVGSILDMISGKTKATFEDMANAIKDLTATIQALSKSGSLSDAIGVLTGQGASQPSASDIFKLPSARMAQLGKVAGIAGAAVAGAGIGYSVGNTIYDATGSRTLGALGGAASGALSGAKLGATFGPWGAAIGGVVGGLTGLIGGLGKSKSAIDAETRARVLGQAQIAQSLADWRAQITGTAEDQRRAAEIDLRVKYLQMVQSIEQTEAGKKQEKQRNKDLAEAAELYKQAQEQLTKTTKTLNEEFSQMVNAVSGYRLNLQLFNFSQQYGPPSTPATPTSGGGYGGGGDSGGGDGRDMDTSFSRAPLVIQLAVDGQVLTRAVVRQARKVAQANLGDSSNIVEGLQLIG